MFNYKAKNHRILLRYLGNVLEKQIIFTGRIYIVPTTPGKHGKPGKTSQNYKNQGKIREKFMKLG